MKQLIIIVLIWMTGAAVLAQPLKEYAGILQNKLVKLEKDNEILQSKILNYRDLPRQLDEAKKERDRFKNKYEYWRNRSKREAELYRDSLNTKENLIRSLQHTLDNKDKQIAALNDTIRFNQTQLKKVKYSLDSVIRVNDTLRYYYDAAMQELSGFKQVKLGLCKRNGIVYQILENRKTGLYVFQCPKNFPGECKLDCIEFEAGYYEKTSAKISGPSRNCRFVIYKKSSYDDEYRFVNAFPVNFIEESSRYPNYRYFRADWAGPTEMDKALKSGTEYKFVIVDAAKLEQVIGLNFDEASDKNLILYTADITVRP